jgi:hypothetical protein
MSLLAAEEIEEIGDIEDRGDRGNIRDNTAMSMEQQLMKCRFTVVHQTNRTILS